jgi:diguanylate cyclase (GGDEF)-like protein/PAS domain S-box-containing protein
LKPKRILVKVTREARRKPAHGSLCGLSSRPSPSFSSLEPEGLLAGLFPPLIMNSPHATSISTLGEGRYIEVNDAWLETTGCQRHHVIGQKAGQLKVDDGLDKAIASIRDIRGTISGPFSLLDRYESCRIDEGGYFQVVWWMPAVLYNRQDSSAYIINTGINITRQKKTEDCLRARKAYLHSILESVNGIIFTFDAAGHFIFVSQGCTEILGHNPDEVITHHVSHYLHPDDLKRVSGVVNQMIATGNPVKDVEYRVRHEDGYWLWNSASLSVAKDELGETLFYVGMATDISKRKQMEEALQLSEKTLAKTFYLNPDPMSITTLSEGVYVDVNQAFLDISGFTRDEVIGRTFFELNIWESPGERDRIIQDIRAKNFNLLDEEVKLRIKSGEIRTFLFSCTLIDIGETDHLLTVCRDISERKRFEEALRSSEDKFAKAFYSSPTPMCIATLKEGRFTAVNKSFCKLLDYSPSELLGKTSAELKILVGPYARGVIKTRLLNKESIQSTEMWFRGKNGSLRLGSYRAETIEIDGEVCLLSIVSDITDQKQAEAQIKYLSYHDKLTGLYSRAFFEEELNRLDAGQALPLSLIIGDVNGLKLINDALGHREGDKILTAVAELLKQFCRNEDIIARWGGDEFIILLPCCSSQNAEKIVERIKKANHLIDALPIQISMSLGVATKNDPGQNIRELLKEAEDKMYRHKLLEARSTRNHFLCSLENTLWSRSHETKEHCERMQCLARRIGLIVKLPESELDSLKLLAALHDIGKIAIPNSILEKPGSLTADEWETIKKHPEIGYRIALSSPEMSPIALAILHHHERWDGSGYPLGLKGEDIPFLSRIISIVDAYDVMVHGRPYQEAVSPREAWKEIRRCAGSQFDPHLVDSLAELMEESPTRFLALEFFI